MTADLIDAAPNARNRWPRRALRRVLAALALLLGAAWSQAAEPAAQRVAVPSLDRAADAAALVLPGFWFPLAGARQLAPALLLLHGCGGPYGASGRLSVRMVEYAALLNAAGFHVLVTDSLTPRGERELCTQRYGERRVTQQQRRRDALGALQWLAAQPGVDAARLGVMGWSNGGSNVLAVLDAHHAEVAAAAVRPAFGVAFYPGCVNDLQRDWTPVAPLLMLLGGADDWTPPGPCQALAARTGRALVEVETYAGAYHGFDGVAPVRLRRDVPNGTHPGQGVHVGGDPAAREASRERLLRFLREVPARRG